jgi:hypothetical protein
MLWQSIISSLSGSDRIIEDVHTMTPEPKYFAKLVNAVQKLLNELIGTERTL